MKLHRMILGNAQSQNLRILQQFEFNEELWLPWQLKEKNLKNLLVPIRKGKSFHIWHVISYSSLLPIYFKLWP